MSMTVDDIVRTYGGTYVGYRMPDSTIVALYIEGGIDEDGDYDGSSEGSLRTDRGTIDLDDPLLVLDFPDVGMTQVGDTCYWFVRRAERQWHRGIRSRSFEQRHGVDCKRIAEALYNPVVYDLETYKERNSSRLSQYCSVSRSGKIMFRDTDIGFFDGEAITAVNEVAVELIKTEDWYDDSIGISIQTR